VILPCDSVGREVATVLIALVARFCGERPFDEVMGGWSCADGPRTFLLALAAVGRKFLFQLPADPGLAAQHGNFSPRANCPTPHR
jgi:hypothetical protein